MTGMGKNVYAVDPNLKEYGGKTLERGQVFELRGLRNDAKLLGQNALQRVYCQPVVKETPLWRCPHCGEQFVGDDVTSAYPQQHLRRNHADEGAAETDQQQVKRPRKRAAPATPEQIEKGEDAPDIEPEGASTATKPPPSRYELTKEGPRAVQR